jgi:Flp pilus assembly pilin Flp
MRAWDARPAPATEGDMIAILQLVTREDGQDLLEYALLVSLIAAVAVAAVTSVGRQISNVLWEYIASTTF